MNKPAKMKNNVNQMLGELFSEALNIVVTSQHTGDIDYFNCECMFSSMKEIALLPCGIESVESELQGMYALCVLTKDVDAIDEIDGVAGLPSEWKELPQFIVKRCPELKRTEDIKKGAYLLGIGSEAMPPADRTKFLQELAGILQTYDLLGPDAFENSILANS